MEDTYWEEDRYPVLQDYLKDKIAALKHAGEVAVAGGWMSPFPTPNETRKAKEHQAEWIRSVDRGEASERSNPDLKNCDRIYTVSEEAESCIHFEKGTCRAGDRCQYSHAMTPIT